MLALVALVGFLPWPGSAWGVSQNRLLFGEERFDRVGTEPDVYQRTFSIPDYVGDPYTLHIVNGNPDGSQRVAIEEAVSSGRVVIDGVEVVSPQEFSQTVATIDKTLSLTAGPHSLEVTLASAPNSYIRLTIAGVITLADLTQARSGHTVNLLGDGTALLTGGRNATGVLDSAEVFDPVTRQTTALTATLTTPRAEHTSSLIPGTDALLIAGEDALGQLFSTERFRVSTGAFTALSPAVSPPRAGHSSTALLDGRVLILGGRSATVLDDAEVFDAQPAVVFTPAYDPEAGTFTALPNNLLTPRWDHQATLLPDGRILVTGGRNDAGVLSAAELFDPVTETFTALAGTLTTPRAGHTSTLLPSGQVLLLGGTDGTGTLSSAELFDPATGTFTVVVQPLLTPRANQTAVLLPFGEVLVSGGENTSGTLATHEFYGPPGADAVPPVVQEITPANGATTVDRTTIIGVRFSEPIDVLTLTAGSANVSDGTPVSATVSPGEAGLMVYLVPASPLAAGTTYTLTLTSDIRDTAGNPLVAFTSTFTTVPAPTIADFTPTSGTPGTSVTITGTNFDPDPARNDVTINGFTATVTSATATSLQVTVPTVPASSETGPIAVTTAGGTATSATTFTVIVQPSITSFTPTSGPVGTSVTITGQNFDPIAANNAVRFNGVLAEVTAASSFELTVVVPVGAPSGPISVTTTGGAATSVAAFTVLNSAPALTPIGAKTVPLGSTLVFTVTATDPNTDFVNFAVTPLPLPFHAAFHTQTGTFTFTPDATQVGTVSLTFVASDGVASSSETVAITVTGPPPNGITGVSGRVTDGFNPLPNLTVKLRVTGQSTVTDANGRFTLTGVPAGRQQLVVDGFAQSYAILVAPVDLIANVTTEIPTDLILPPIDTANAVPVNPAATTVITNPNLPGVSVTIAAGAAKNADGSSYTGSLSISPVPEYGRPESRPVELRPGLSITIQPAGIRIDPPAPVTFPNVDNMTPGSELDLWSLSPDTGTFLQVGRGRVSADGQHIETISGGVRKTAWHFALALPAALAGTGNNNTDRCTDCQVGSTADLGAGALSQAITVPGVRTLGTSRDLSLRYRSTSADLRPLIPFTASLDERTAVPPTFSARLTLGGVQQGEEVYWSAATLPPASTFRLGLSVDASSLPTGRYPFELMLFSNYPQSSIGSGRLEQVTVRNERQSPYGAGWTLSGVDRLLVQPGGAVLLAQGDGLTDRFAPIERPLVIESFDRARCTTVNNRNTNFVAGEVHLAARNDLQDTSLFGPLGTVTRPVTLRSGINQVTLQALEGVDIFVINLTPQELSSSEVAALEQFVEEGGAVLEMRNLASGRPLILGTTPGPFVGDTTAELTVDGLNSALVQGPFGSVTSPLPTGAIGTFATTDSATVIATSDAKPSVLQLEAAGAFSGLGRAVFIGDEEIFASGFAGGGSNLYTFNRTFFLNVLAYLAGTPGFRVPTPPPTTFVKYQGPPGDFSTLVKNTDGSFTRTLKDGTTVHFNAEGLQTSVADRNGNTTTYAYDAEGRLTTITDPAGLVTTFSYSGSVLASITDPAARVTAFEHDSLGNLTAVTLADGSRQEFDYDPQHRLTERTDARGQVTTYAYHHTGRLSQVTLPTGVTRAVTQTQTAAVPNLEAGEGTATNPAPLAPPAPPAIFQDGRGNSTTFQLDALGNVTTQTDALNRTTTIQRDSQGNPTQITRPNGAVTTMTYDTAGNLLTTIEQAIAATTTFTYESTFNQVTSIMDPKGNTTTIAYDANGNPTQVTDALNNSTTMTYDARGLLLSTTDALNHVTSFTYDDLGRLLTTTDPLNRTTTLSYDAAGNVATSMDALGRVTAFEYDALNRLKKVTDPTGGITQYAYDGNGNLVSVTDAKNQTTTFTYDGLNRLASTTDPLGNTETYAYDGADNLISRLTPNGATITFEYDVGNQLVKKILPGNQLTTYAYDAVGNMTNVVDQDSALTMTYDLANRLTAVSTAGSPVQPEVTLSYTYDKNGNRLSLTDPTGSNSYAYDALNRLNTLTSPAGSFAYAYDALSRRTSLTLPNGTQTTYSYDVASQVTEILHKVQATSTVINQATYTYNAVGNRTSLTDRRGVQTFGYEALDRLATATHPLTLDQTYSYDPVGNRLNNASQHNAANQLTEDAGFTYQYDANGNLTRKTVKANGNYTQYTYDAENHLIKVEEFSAGSSTPAFTSTYRYDGLGRRIEKIGNGVTRRYVYDAENILLEYDETNTLQARYTHGPGIDESIAMERGGTNYIYHQDGLGSVTELTDSSGANVKSYAYDAWGNVLEQPGSVENPYTFTGREFDAETGLYYYRARTYDSAVGRFLQKDPIGFIAGPHLYVYVRNNPVTTRDPLGLIPCQVCHDNLRDCRDNALGFFGTCVELVTSVCAGVCAKFNPTIACVVTCVGTGVTACGAAVFSMLVECGNVFNTCLSGCDSCPTADPSTPRRDPPASG